MGLPVSSLEGGVCLVVPNPVKMQVGPATVVVPAPSIAQVATMKGTSKKVLIRNKEAVVVTSKASASQGDEMGALGGTKSGTHGGQVEVKKGASVTRFEGKEPGTVTCQTEHNTGNVPNGQQVAPSQGTVFAA